MLSEIGKESDVYKSLDFNYEKLQENSGRVCVCNCVCTIVCE